MDKAERTRLKTLANDAVIATFGESNLTAQLAEALERCVEALDNYAERDECEACDECPKHGGLLE